MQDNSSTFLQDVLSNAVLALFVLMLIALVQIGNRGLLRLSDLSNGTTTGAGATQQGELNPEVEGTADGSGQIDLADIEVVWVALESPTHMLDIKYQPDSSPPSGKMKAIGDSRSDNRGTQALFRSNGPVDNGRFIVGNLSTDTVVTLTVFADALFVSQQVVPVSVAQPTISIRRDADSGSGIVIANE